ncbi:MAG: tryptophan synthase subunit alpha [Verrucomicrobiales bacterium]|jgi:tryptophan synthase alpha chain|nr:tryptophan synthase subunit alpha [Verrucomicrobiales bacterium]
MNRIDALFQTLTAKKRKAFVAYITAGDPNLDRTVDIVLGLEHVGADLVELGVPFSDPLADGVVNQLAAQRALASGTTLTAIFDTVKKIREKSQIPLVLFTYYNPIFHLGMEQFTKLAVSAGVDGALILDLPPEEAEHEWPESELKRITLIAPTTPQERIQKIAPSASGFIYYVSRAGVTGMQDQVAADISEHLAQIRASSKLPVCVGFGVSKPEHAALIAKVADGVIVGSAIVNHIANHQQDTNLGETIRTFVEPLVQATHNA